VPTSAVKPAFCLTGEASEYFWPETSGAGLANATAGPDSIDSTATATAVIMVLMHASVTLQRSDLGRTSTADSVRKYLIHRRSVAGRMLTRRWPMLMASRAPFNTQRADGVLVEVSYGKVGCQAGRNSQRLFSVRSLGSDFVTPTHESITPDDKRVDDGSPTSSARGVRSHRCLAHKTGPREKTWSWP
jgi:hypothetical protein